MRRHISPALVAVPTLLVLSAAAAPALAASRLESLRCEWLVEPLAVESARPRLSWILDSDEPGQRQTGYQITVTADDGAVLWDSGRVASDRSVHIEYAGKPLASRQRAVWKVRVWDKDGKPLDSPAAAFEMGLLEPAAWQGARWIGAPVGSTSTAPRFDGAAMRWIWYPDPGDLAVEAPAGDRWLRRTVKLPGGAIRNAQFALTVDGSGSLWVNGKKAGQGGGNNNPTLLDVRPLLRPGKNELEIRASNRGAAAGAIGQLIVEVAGRKPLTISTDASWTAARDAGGPFVPVREIAPLGVGTHWKDLSFDRVRIRELAPSPLLRKEFTVAGGVRRARLYATALGWYELWLNGERVGTDHFAPGWTDYDKRVQYQAHDVTRLVRTGDNAIGALLGDGWYTGHVGLAGRHMYGPYPLRLRALLVIDRDDGGQEIITTDGSWKVSQAGPIVENDLMAGEVYDARKERNVAGWNRPGFRAAGWRAVDALEAPHLDARLSAEPTAPVRVTEDLPAIAVNQPRPGVFVFDLGQNMVGWVRLSVKGRAGTTVTLRHAEVLNPDGTLYTANLRAATQTDRYTLRGDPAGETWEPRFTFHGFRYVEVTGYPGVPSREAIVGRVAHSDTPRTGTFTSSSPLVDKLVRNIEWGQRGNFVSVPTDCPQRDERLGWMGDAQIFARTACHNMDVAAFFTKWMRDVVDAQNEEGGFPDTAPRVPGNKSTGAPGWGDAGVIVPWVMYECYEDRRLLEQTFPAMVRWVELIRRQNPDGLWRQGRNADFGEWLSIDADTDKEALATAFYAYSAQLAGKVARTIGKTAEASAYEALFRTIKAAFQGAYVKPDGRVKSDTQAIYAVALRFGLLDEPVRRRVGERLVADIEARGWHLSTGFLGVGHLLPALTDVGRVDVAYRLLNQDTFPSWGYSIKHGATTIWERWDGWTADKGFQNPGMNSFNHYSFGSVGEWLYGTVAGIQPATPGYKVIRFRPRPGGGLTHVDATLATVHGRIESHWRIDAGRFRLRVRVPANTTATVELPGDARPFPVGPGVHEFERPAPGPTTAQR
jgi:alpha-L-rhamnosidase